MERKGFIGGSDLYSIMNGDLLNLWEVKTGRAQPDDLSGEFRVQLGVATEQFHIDWFSNRTGYMVIDQQREISTDIDGVIYKGQMDAIIEGQVVLECKHTSSTKTMDNMLNTYLPQLHLYMKLTETREAFFSVIFGNTWQWCRVTFNDDYWNNVHEKVVKFWHHVTNDIQPPTLSENKIDWSSVEIDGLVARDASKDNHFNSLAQDFISTADVAKQHEATKKELRSLIQDNEREVYCDVLTIKRDKRGACRITKK